MPTDRQTAADIALRLQGCLDALDAIGASLAAAHLSAALTALETQIEPGTDGADGL